MSKTFSRKKICRLNGNFSGCFRFSGNDMVDNSYLSVLSLHLAGSLQTRIPGNRRRQVGEWVNEAYALSLKEELDSGESTEEMDSGEGESTEEMDSGDST